MKALGIFSEMEPDKHKWPRMADHVASAASAEESLVLRYLERGTCALVSGSVRYDCMYLRADAARPIGEFALMTDGCRYWLDELRYYVRVYHVALPEDFLAQARDSGWLPRSATHEECLAARIAWKYHRRGVPWGLLCQAGHSASA